LKNLGGTKTQPQKFGFFSGTNCLVDTSHGVSYLNEIKDSISAAFEWVVNDSVLCGEPMRGVKFNLVDALLHSDTIHRGGSQIILTARQVLYAAMLAASPHMVEPVYLADIQTEQEVIGKIYACLAQRRGNVIEEVPKIGTPLCLVKGYIPVLESFGVTAELREATSGRAFPQLVFDHWKVLDDEKGLQVIVDVRKRKGKKAELPTLDDYNDKL